MIDEFSREIANSINDLTNYAHNLKAWHRVLSDMTEDEQFDVHHDAIDPLAVTAINLPHVIRSRLTHDFRNAYNHRFSPRIGHGITQVVSRSIDPTSKQVTYTYTMLDGIKLDPLTDLLTGQCERAYVAFAAFQDLVNDQIATIK
ncbi:hypothetical protein CO675_10405 [Bradyrhizobium sp. C9]|nr:hypothetical protein CO675_10405 [Bradyrhizobium sp. C9]